MEEIDVTPDIVSEICGYIRIGAPFDTAALACGMSRKQIDLARANLERPKDEFYKEFAHDIKKAESQFEVIQLMKVSAEGGAKGAQWLLERVENTKKKPKSGRKDQDLSDLDLDISGWE